MWFVWAAAFLLSSNTHLYAAAAAADTVSHGRPLLGNQTIVSKGAIFELGFFAPGKSPKYYLGIWFHEPHEPPGREVVWVANRGSPIANISTAELKISADGNLVLVVRSNATVWSTALASPTSAHSIAVLLDSGNLVLRDELDPSRVLWQSFDHPTDTWLPTQPLGRNRVTGEIQVLTSWRNLEDPAPGLFSHSIDPNGTDQFLLFRNGSKYWSSGNWSGEIYPAIPEWTRNTPGMMKHVANEEGTFISFTWKGIPTSAVMGLPGQMLVRRWIKGEWQTLPVLPKDRCSVPSLCGAFSSCNPDSTTPCSCLMGFRPQDPRAWNLSDWSGGCVRKTPLQCSNISSTVQRSGDVFKALLNLELPTNNFQSIAAGSSEECEATCLGDCSCTAYSYRDDKCRVWKGDIFDLRQLSDSEGSLGQGQSGALHLRLSASDLKHYGHRRQHMIPVVVSIAAAVGSFLCMGIIVFGLHKKFHMSKSSVKPDGIGVSLLTFSFKELVRASNNFSERLGGGGFGTVYKGALADSTAVAIKELRGFNQGEKQFRAEVSTVGGTHHVNLVGLVGFCSEGVHRMLVYEYMPNGSLESHLFRESSTIMDWRARFGVALGTARGLAYLHEECRDCIIHCDVKPENILLDAAASPKISDFGMAKLLGRDFSRVLTTMRGTIGYLAPEWISGMPITAKVDVYSYGMMLFEIISGRRNTEAFRDGNDVFLPIWAASRVREGKVLCLLDERLEGDCDVAELNRVCRAACWCIQDYEGQRPSMGQVVHILEGALEVDVPPVPSLLQHIVQNLDSGRELSIHFPKK